MSATDRQPVGPVLAVVPVRASDLAATGGLPRLGDRPLLAYTLEAARAARLVDRVVVTTDSEEVRAAARALGAEAPFLRPAELATATVPLGRVLAHCLEWLEAQEGYRPQVVVLLEMTHPFREPGLIDRVITALIEDDLDTVFTAHEERHNFWTVNRYGELEPLTEETATRSQRAPVYREMSGLACASRAEVIRRGQRLGKRVGIVPLSSPESLVDTQDPGGLGLARRLL